MTCLTLPVSVSSAVSLAAALRNRATRDRLGLFTAEGIRFLLEADALQAPLHSLLWCPPLLSNNVARRTIRRLRRSGLPVFSLTPAQFQTLARGAEPQGVIVVAHQNTLPLSQHQTQGLCWLALDEIRSPGNLGTILRTADASGAAGLILIGERIDPYDPSCVRASMGALFNVPIVRASLTEFCEWKAAQDYQLVGTSPHAARCFYDFQFSPRTVLWLGSERKGLSAGQMAQCDATVRIPMRGRADSLNVAVAAGICLYEIYRQSAGAMCMERL
jgi:RNA methyltransferase, TrmH family